MTSGKLFKPFVCPGRTPKHHLTIVIHKERPWSDVLRDVWRW
jgi:hypothetical protein